MLRQYYCLFFIVGAIIATPLWAHNLSASNADFVQGIDGPAIFAFIYLGAKHMVTGYDHLLFLCGVMFFLVKTKDVIIYASLFTLGHSITLLAGVINGWQVDAYLVDAIIATSIIYKAFENMQGFKQLFNLEVNTRLAVFVFGLVHGLGLATKLQGLDLAANGLVANILSFNLGVEIGQLLALFTVVLGLNIWRQSSHFSQQTLTANMLIMSCGLFLFGFHLTGFIQA